MVLVWHSHSRNLHHAQEFNLYLVKCTGHVYTTHGCFISKILLIVKFISMRLKKNSRIESEDAKNYVKKLGIALTTHYAQNFDHL